MTVKTITFDKRPSKTLIGNVFCDDEEIQPKEMPNNFQVIRVHGRVTWEFHGPGDDTAALMLKRRANLSLEQLDLAEYARDSSPDGVTTVHFDFKPDEKNPFWQRGAAGKILVDSHFLLKVIEIVLNFDVTTSNHGIACSGESLAVCCYVGDEEDYELTFDDIHVQLDVKYFHSTVRLIIE